MFITNPSKVHLLRGKEECRIMSEFNIFKSECLFKYDITVYESFCSLFDNLPIAASINTVFFCINGGLSP